MNLKSFLSERLLKSTYKFTILFGLYAVGYTLMPHLLAKDTKQYIEDNLEHRMQLQEETFGIQHFGVPKVSFRTEEDSTGNGSYFIGADSIEVITANTKTSFGIFTQILENMFDAKAMHANEIIDHELGHFYVDNLMKSKTGKNWPDYSFVNKAETQIEYDSLWPRIIATQMVSEGIAQYFCYEINPEATKPRALDYNKDGTVSEDRIVYEISYHVVKPVIDKYGEKGIIHMANNLPYDNEIFVPMAYTDRILFELEQLEEK